MVYQYGCGICSYKTQLYGVIICISCSPGQVTRKKSYADSIGFNFADIVAREVEIIVAARDSLGFDDLDLVVDEYKCLRITVNTLSMKLSNIALLYKHCVRIELETSSRHNLSKHTLCTSDIV